MSAGTFRVYVILGNDAMQNAEHVAGALTKLASHLDHEGPKFMKGDGPVFDANGNTVGGWHMDFAGDA